MIENDNKYYVYVYLDPRKSGMFKYGNHVFGFEPFYVGKGFDNRLYDHLQPNDIKNNGNKLKTNKINKLLKSGYDLKYFIIKIKNNVNHDESCLLEKELIKLIGRKDLKLGPLCNLTEGGEGSFGYKHTPESLNKMSGRFGIKIHTNESKKLISIANIGKKMSDETKKLISSAQKNIQHTKERNEKISKTRKEIFSKMSSEERRYKLGHNRGIILSQEQKDKISKSLIGRIFTPEHSKNKSLAQIDENNPSAKLSNIQNEEIYELYMDGLSFKELSLEYNVHTTTIRRNIIKHNHRNDINGK